MLCITYYAFFASFFMAVFLICHIMPPLPQNMEISSCGRCKAGQTGSDTWDLQRAQAKRGNCKGFGGALQSFAGRSMGRWVDGDFCQSPCHEVLAQSLDNGGKSQMYLDGLWGCELVGDTFGNGGVKLGGHLKGWCNSWGLLALHFVSSFEDLVPLLVPCELGRNTLWTFSFGAAFVPCARAIWDMLQFIAPARTRYKDGLGFLSLPVQMHVIRSGSKLRNTSKHKVDGLS